MSHIGAASIYSVDTIRVPADRLPSSGDQTSSDPNDTKKIVLTSNDQLYSELRDKNFNAVGPILSQRAKAVSAKYDVSLRRWQTLYER